MRCFLLLFILSFAFPALAKERAPRFTVTAAIIGKDFVTGRKITVPPGRGYKFEIVDANTLRPYMKVYDSAGLEVQAHFPLPSLIKKLSPEELKARLEKEEAKPVSKEELKEEISDGLEATMQGATVAKEGCCEVDGKKEEPAEEPTEEPLAETEPVEEEVAEEAPAEEEIAEEPAAEEEPELEADSLEIESPPEDFVDVSPGMIEAASTAAEPVKAGKKRDIIAGLEVESVPIPEPRPKRDEKRSPAIQRPEAEEYVSLPDQVPVPKWRPSKLDRASAPRPDRIIEKEDDVEKASSPRRPASSSLCRAFDAFKSKGVPEKPLRQALAYLEKNKEKFGDQRYVSIADYSQNSTKKRFYLLDMKTLSVTKEKVSHGAGRRDSGDKNHDGMLNACGGSGSERTRGGFFRVGDYYFSQKGRFKWPMLTRKPARNGMKLYGLTPGVNTSVYNDGYVMHEAKYNRGSGKMGRSDGCPAFAPGRGKPILAKLRGGSLQYHYTPMCKEHHSRALRQARGWESFCK